MVLTALAVLAWAAWIICALFVYIHAFQRSVGTGFMVLLIPFYVFVYAFSQFEHVRKNVIVPGLCASAGLSLVLLVAVQAQAFAAAAVPAYP